MENDTKAFDALNLNALEEITFEKVEHPKVHEWEQRGNDLLCRSCTNKHAAVDAVPPGMMLSKDEKGAYTFIPLT